MPRQRPGPVPRIATPLKAFTQRFGFFLLLGLTVGLITLGKADVVMVERVRTAVADAVSPILTVMAQPVRAAERGVAHVVELINLREEVARLREENALLRQWENAARHLAVENTRLRSLTQTVPERRYGYISARVVADSSGVFVRSMLINAGRRENIEKGQAVLIESGMVGRIVDVGRRVSRVMLLTDLNSRVPVRLESSGVRGVLAGDNSPLMRLRYLPPDAPVVVGERLVTSGDGGVFPPGLAVGTVVGAAGSAIRVQPVTATSRLDYVSIIDYGLEGILEDPVPAPAPDPALAPLAAPDAGTGNGKEGTP